MLMLELNLDHLVKELKVLQLSQVDSDTSHVVIPALGVLVPDGNCQALGGQFSKWHLNMTEVGVLDWTFYLIQTWNWKLCFHTGSKFLSQTWVCSFPAWNQVLGSITSALNISYRNKLEMKQTINFLVNKHFLLFNQINLGIWILAPFSKQIFSLLNINIQASIDIVELKSSKCCRSA